MHELNMAAEIRDRTLRAVEPECEGISCFRENGCRYWGPGTLSYGGKNQTTDTANRIIGFI